MKKSCVATMQCPLLKEIKTYLTTDLKLPLIVPKNIEEKFSAVTQIYPKSSSLVMLYSNNELKLVEKKWGYPSPFQRIVFFTTLA